MEDQNKDYKKAVTKKLLELDPLAEAEKLTGKSYKNDKETSNLGFLLQIQKSKETNKLLTELDDTLFSNTEKDYLRKMKGFGFDEVLKLPFVNEKGITERFYVLFHRNLGILLTFDTYTWGDDGSWAKAGEEVPHPGVNGGNFYYNWSPNPKINRIGLTSSGGFMRRKADRFLTMFDKNFEKEIDQTTLNIVPELDWENSTSEERSVRYKEIQDALDKLGHRTVWSGNHDCREAVKLKITNMINKGVFLPKWKEQPFLWLLHYMDTKTKGYDYKKINEERIAMLPQYVRDAITP